MYQRAAFRVGDCGMYRYICTYLQLWHLHVAADCAHVLIALDVSEALRQFVEHTAVSLLNAGEAPEHVKLQSCACMCLSGQVTNSCEWVVKQVIPPEKLQVNVCSFDKLTFFLLDKA
jgi:hypothetical protein